MEEDINFKLHRNKILNRIETFNLFLIENEPKTGKNPKARGCGFFQKMDSRQKSQTRLGDVHPGAVIGAGSPMGTGRLPGQRKRRL